MKALFSAKAKKENRLTTKKRNVGVLSPGHDESKTEKDFQDNEDYRSGAKEEDMGAISNLLQQANSFIE